MGIMSFVMDRYAAFIRHYRLKHRPRIDAEDNWFAGQPTLADTIRNAALGRTSQFRDNADFLRPIFCLEVVSNPEDRANQ